MRVLSWMVLAAAFVTGSALAAGEGVVEGRVRGPKKRAVKKAAVLVRVKAWPGGRFQMRAHEATTDGKGRFELRGVIPAGTRYGAYVALLAPGHTLVSHYHWSGQGQPMPALELTTAAAHPLKLRFVDAEGAAISGVRAFPSLRTTAEGERYTAQPGRSDAGIQTSDRKGLVTMEHFLPGEWVGVHVEFPGGSWEQRTFLVPETHGPIDIPRTAPQTPDRDLTVGDDADKRYFLMGPKPGDIEPESGFGLVLVLPGGDGSTEYRTWVREQYDHWVDAGFVFAELVAPVWDPSDPDRVVWPTKAREQTGMKFTTDAFVSDVVADVGARMKIDPDRVLAVGWSSSGPALYYISSLKETPVRGYLVAMSVFFRNQLDALKNVSGRAFFILHSPTDAVCLPKFAAEARRTLEKHRAKVESATYEGGHGWGGESTDIARRGLHWLDEQVRAATRKR